MANWDNLKAAIQDVIKTNGNEEITGQVLQNTLLSIVNNLGENATFAGIATPATNPVTPDGSVFYLASTPGEYANFNGLKVLDDEVVIFLWNNSAWAKKITGFATQEKLSELGSEVEQLKKEASSTEDLLKNVLQLYSDKIIPSAYEKGYYGNYRESAGKFVSDSNWRCFVVRGNLGGRNISLFISYVAVNGWGCNCFDDNGNVLGYNTKAEYEYVLPEGTTWISLNFNIDVFTEEQLANLVVFFDLESEKSQSVLYKNRYLAIGSSSTEKVVAMYGNKGSYANRIATRNGMTLTNLGKSGYSMSETNSPVYGNLCHESETFTDVYDIHTIMIGANDIQLGVTFNGIDETALTDFYGAMKYYINNFIERCPSCRWGIIVPFAIPYNDFDKMRTACKEIAKYYGVSCLDINEYGYSGIFANTSDSKYTTGQMTIRQAQYQSNPQHLNDFGMERLSYVVEKWMETL